MDIDTRRNLLETLETIEASLVARIVKSDRYLPPTINSKVVFLGSHPYSARENAFRRHETAQLVNNYNKLRKNWDSEVLELPKGDFQKELDAAKNLDDEIPASNALATYDLDDSAKGLQRFACEFTKGEIRDFGGMFPPQENFGESINLAPFYHKLISDGAISSDVSYRGFLADFKKYSKQGGPELANYLIEFYDRLNYVGDGTGSSAQEYLTRHTPDSDKRPHCSYCAKEFSNANVYAAHIESKRHKRAVKTAESKNLKPIFLCSVDETLLELVQPYISQASANLDRKAGMSVADRELEAEAIDRERYEEDEWKSDDESLHENTEASNNTGLPTTRPLTGPEGRPIPRWLFKLQGLGAVFRCEICDGGAKFLGRKMYERHFQDQMHQSRLTQLGFTPSAAFRGVATLREAQEIQKNQKRFNAPLPIFEKEVEDDEGNALSERMYQDLKEQGLL